MPEHRAQRRAARTCSTRAGSTPTPPTAATSDGLYLTKDFGQNWTKLRIPTCRRPCARCQAAVPTNDTQPRPTTTCSATPSFQGQGNYDIALAIDPTTPTSSTSAGPAASPRASSGSTSPPRPTPHAFYLANDRNDGGPLTVNTTAASAVKQTPLNPRASGLRPPRSPTINLIRDPSNPLGGQLNVLSSITSPTLNNGAAARSGSRSTLRAGTDIAPALTILDPLTGQARLDLRRRPGRLVGRRRRRRHVQHRHRHVGGDPGGCATATSRSPSSTTGPRSPECWPPRSPGRCSTARPRTTASRSDPRHPRPRATSAGAARRRRRHRRGHRPEGIGHDLPVQLALLRRQHDRLLPGQRRRPDHRPDPGERPPARCPTRSGRTPAGSTSPSTRSTATRIVISSAAGRIFRTAGPGPYLVRDRRTRSTLTAPTPRPWPIGAPDPNGPRPAATRQLHLRRHRRRQHLRHPDRRRRRQATPGPTSPPASTARPSRRSSPTRLRGSHEAYAVTTARASTTSPTRSATGATWQNITGNLFKLIHTPPSATAALADQKLLESAPRRSSPTGGTSSPTATPPTRPADPPDALRRRNGRRLPLARQGPDLDAVPFRTSRAATTPRRAPPADGGGLPNAHVTDLDLSLGNIDPTTGRPVGRPRRPEPPARDHLRPRLLRHPAGPDRLPEHAELDPTLPAPGGSAGGGPRPTGPRSVTSPSPSSTASASRPPSATSSGSRSST